MRLVNHECFRPKCTVVRILSLAIVRTLCLVLQELALRFVNIEKLRPGFRYLEGGNAAVSRHLRLSITVLQFVIRGEL